MFTTLVNRISGRVLIIDNDKTRYNRLRQRVHDWADLIGNDGSLYMYTLTYDTKGTLGSAHQWRANHIREFMLALRQYLGSALLGYAWVAELTKAGVVHYHVLIRVVSGTYLPKPDKAGLWKYGLTRMDKAKTPFYIVKYVGKSYQKDFFKYPKGARLFAVWIAGDKQLDLRYRSLKDWQKKIVDDHGWEFLGDYKKPDTGWVYVSSSQTVNYSKLKGIEALRFMYPHLFDELSDDYLLENHCG